MLIKDLLNSVKFPILINSFNRPTYLKLLVDQFNALDITPIILDNCSNSLELLEYYKAHTNKKFLLIKFDKNYNHNVIFSNEIYLNLPNYFAYTDCDIKLNLNLPKNFLEILCNLTKHFTSFKAGFALEINNIKLKNKLNFNEFTIKKWENIFWTKPLKHESLEVYAAAIDTTFAVYNKRNDKYCGGKGKENSVRVAGNFTAIHYPWIEKDPMPKSEEDFYLENGNLKIINWHNKN